jgi:hypothetical protein
MGEFGKVLDLNLELSRRMEKKARFDWLVEIGLMGHDPVSGEYWAIAEREEIGRIDMPCG